MILVMFQQKVALKISMSTTLFNFVHQFCQLSSSFLSTLVQLCAGYEVGYAEAKANGELPALGAKN
jgi:hypothetical protein